MNEKDLAILMNAKPATARLWTSGAVRPCGAKKDLWSVRGLYTDELNEMNEHEAEKYVKKDNIWK